MKAKLVVAVVLHALFAYYVTVTERFEGFRPALPIVMWLLVWVSLTGAAWLAAGRKRKPAAIMLAAASIPFIPIGVVGYRVARASLAEQGEKFWGSPKPWLLEYLAIIPLVLWVLWMSQYW